MFSIIWHFVAVHIWWVVGSFSTVGLIGLVALIVFCGFPISTIIAAVFGLGREAIKFFETPLGDVVGLILLIIAVGIAVDVHQIRVDNAATQGIVRKALDAQAAKAAADRKARDAYVTQKVTTDAKTRIAQIEAEKAALEKKAQDYETALENSKRAQCVVTPDDLPRRVRH